VERQIQEALEQGQFDHLPGRGRPLPPMDYDKAPPEERLAQKIIKDAGYVPEWIDLENEIRRDWAAAEQMRANLRAWQERMRADLPGLPPDEQERLQGRLDAERDRVREAYADLLVNLKQKVRRYNLLVPLVDRQMMGVQVEEHLAEFEAEFPLEQKLAGWLVGSLAEGQVSSLRNEPTDRPANEPPRPRTWLLQARETYARLTRRARAFKEARERPSEEKG
jgi:hypothetical protein